MDNHPPAYNPPYDSPLEDDFAFNITKYLEPTVSLIPQYEVQTICGTFRIDFVIQGPKGLTGFECDGKEFHDASRDEWRDAMILGTKAVDAIYRLRGSDVYYRIEDILYIITKWNPELFSHRGLLNLETLSSDEAKAADREIPRSLSIITYRDEEGSSFSGSHEPLHLRMERRHLHSPRGQRQFWEAAFRFASKIGGGNLDDVMKKYRAQKIGDGSDW